MPGAAKATKSSALLSRIFSEAEGEADAAKVLTTAQHRANAMAAKLLAARECPADLIGWGRAHGIPTFAEVTWQAGFLAGMRAAALVDAECARIMAMPDADLLAEAQAEGADVEAEAARMRAWFEREVARRG